MPSGGSRSKQCGLEVRARLNRHETHTFSPDCKVSSLFFLFFPSLPLPFYPSASIGSPYIGSNGSKHAAVLSVGLPVKSKRFYVELAHVTPLPALALLQVFTCLNPPGF